MVHGFCENAEIVPFREEKCPVCDLAVIKMVLWLWQKCAYVYFGEIKEMQESQTLYSRLDRQLDKWFSGRTMSYKNMIALIIPLLIDQIFLACLNFFNTSMISYTDLAAVGAVNTVDSLNSFAWNIFVALATGGTIVVAHCNSRKDKRAVIPAMRTAILMVGSVAMGMGLLLALGAKFVLRVVFSAGEAVLMDYATTYLWGSALSYLGFAVMEAALGVLRGLGHTRSSLVLTITMNLSYFALNFLFIFVMHMGILGMVIAMIISRYLAAIFAVMHVISVANDFPREDGHHKKSTLLMLKRMFTIGGPFASEQIFFNGGKILTQTYIVGMGTLAIATNAIATSLTAVFQIPANTFALAIVTIVGRCIANKDLEQAKKTVRSFFILTCLSFLSMGVVLLPSLQHILAIFGETAEIRQDIYLIMYLNTAMQGFLWAGSFLIPAAMRAAGDLKFTSLTGLITMWVVRVALGYILGVVCGLDILGIWLAMECEWAVRSTLFLIRFRGEKWLSHRLVV